MKAPEADEAPDRIEEEAMVHPKSSSKFSLIIEDDRAAAWMAINNTFTKSPLGNWDKHAALHGILIQLGKSKRWPDEFLMDEIEKVQLKGETDWALDKVMLEDPSSVWWINVTKAANPMRPEHLERLHVSPPRSLHKYFVPYAGGITIWPQGDLDIRMQLSKKEDYHSTFTFELQKPVTVEVYRNGERQEIPSEVTEITIVKATGRPPQGNTQNPPQYP